MECNLVPDLVLFSDYGGDYDAYVSATYEIYQNTFASRTFFFEGKRIAHKKHPEIKGMSATFWHITSSGSEEESKLPDLRRYEVIAWPAFILDYCLNKCQNLLIWKNRRKGKTRICLWCQDINYVVILDERDDFCIFWTAYPVSYEHTRRKFLKEWQEYRASGVE